MSDDAQEKNHKAERENNTNNKQQQTKTGQGIGRDWQGKKGAPGNVVRNVRGNDDSSGVSVCSRGNPSSTPTKPLAQQSWMAIEIPSIFDVCTCIRSENSNRRDEIGLKFGLLSSLGMC